MRVATVLVSMTPQLGTCKVAVSDDKGSVLFTNSADGMQVSEALDLGADGRKFLAIQADSSPYILSVLSFETNPKIIATIKNEYGFWIQDGCDDGLPHIWTADGAFQGDAEIVDIYHYDLLVPEVAFGLSGDKLVDATASCTPHFNHFVAALQKDLTPRETADFKNRQMKDAFRSGEVKGDILGIALANLYAGRSANSQKILREYWPTDDQARISDWMVQRRAAGVTAHLQDSALR
jgi:hypothetical protein